LTAQDPVPVTAIYTSGLSAKRDAADRINNFMNDRSINAITVTEPGLFSNETIIFMAITIPLAWVVNVLWKVLGEIGRGG
jgi:hypothetical protein